MKKSNIALITALYDIKDANSLLKTGNTVTSQSYRRVLRNGLE